jgi:hypothetical protein
LIKRAAEEFETIKELRDAAKPGDILLTRAVKPGLWSMAVSAAQGTAYGHSALYAGKGKVIDARVREGVFVTSLPEVIKEWGGGRDVRLYAPKVSDKQREAALRTAKELIGTPYSTRNALRSAGVPVPEKADAVICSRVIAEAYPTLVKGRDVDRTRPVDISNSPRVELVGELEHSKVAKDLLPGGKADRRAPRDFDARQLRLGELVEQEHTDNHAMAREIAMDHLAEHPEYYTALKKMESKLEKSGASEQMVRAINPAALVPTREDMPTPLRRMTPSTLFADAKTAEVSPPRQSRQSTLLMDARKSIDKLRNLGTQTTGELLRGAAVGAAVNPVIGVMARAIEGGKRPDKLVRKLTADAVRGAAGGIMIQGLRGTVERSVERRRLQNALPALKGDLKREAVEVVNA